MELICPLCGLPLTIENKTCRCGKAGNEIRSNHQWTEIDVNRKERVLTVVRTLLFENELT